MKSALQTLTIVFIVSILLNSLILIAQWYALLPSGSQIYLQYAVVLVVPVTLVMLFMPVLVLALALPYKRKRTLVILGACTIYVATGFLIVKLSMIYREHVFDDLAQRSQGLVAAIQRYVVEQGRPPDNLHSLVPEYLSNIPNTDLGAYPEYSYEVNKDIDRGFENRWILYISIPKSGLGKGSEKFIYSPNQELPIPGVDKVLWRVGNWVYVREE